MVLEINLHSVILLVGPTNCGKTTFVQNKLIPAIKDNDPNNLINIGYLSSDVVRQELLGKQLSKYDERMTQVSSVAFEKLYSDLEYYLKFPVKKEIVIVDTTGLSEDFRNKVFQICDKHNYLLDIIMFEYKNKDNYFLYEPEDKNITKIIWGHLKKMKNFYSCKKNYKKLQIIYKV